MDAETPPKRPAVLKALSDGHYDDWIRLVQRKGPQNSHCKDPERFAMLLYEGIQLATT